MRDRTYIVDIGGQGNNSDQWELLPGYFREGACGRGFRVTTAALSPAATIAPCPCDVVTVIREDSVMLR